MGIRVTKKGWKVARINLSRVSTNLIVGMRSIHVAKFAEQTRRYLVNGIKLQRFKLTPLTRRYLRTKVAQGYDRRTLIRSKAFVGAIGVRKEGKQGFWVGIDPRKMTRGRDIHSASGKSYRTVGSVPMTKLATWLEFGTKGKKGMPARPVWRPTERWVEKAWPAHMEGAIKRDVRGG